MAHPVRDVSDVPQDLTIVRRPDAASDDWRLFRAGFIAMVALLVLASCAYMPVAVEGLRPVQERGAEPSDNPWIFVPVGAWITRDTVTPVSVGMCEATACPQRFAVAVLDVRGAEARTVTRSLRNPASLARLLEAGNVRRRGLVATANRSVPAAIAARRMPRRIAADARPLRHRAFHGFSMTIRRMEDGARTAHAAVLGRSRAGGLRVVVVIGERAGQVEAAAKAAAEANL
jgi:hypothetical protein